MYSTRFNYTMHYPLGTEKHKLWFAKDSWFAMTDKSGTGQKRKIHHW